MAQFSCIRHFGASTPAGGSAVLLGLLLCSVSLVLGHEQQSSQQQQGSASQQSSPQQGAKADPNSTASPSKDADSIGPLPIKRRKVWTNDEVVGLRSPMDLYLAEKDAQAAAAARAAAQAKLSKQEDSAKEGEPTIKLPTTVEETQKLIKDRQDQINDEQSALERLIRELPDAPEDQKATMQKEIDRVASDVPKVRRELKTLQDHLEKLSKAQLQEASPPSPAPPPPAQ